MFYSVLFPTEESAQKPRNQRAPDCFADLQLDRILKAVLPDYADFHLEEYFYTPLTDPETVRYRQGVMEELEEPEKRAAVEEIIRRIPETRAILEETRPKLLKGGLLTGEKLTDNYLEMGRFLDTLVSYLDAVNDLNEILQKLDLRSAGLRKLSAYLTDYCSSEQLRDMTAWRQRIRENLKHIRFNMLVKPLSIRVTPYEGQEDYAERITTLFSRFRQEESRSFLRPIEEKPRSERIENQVLKMVSKLYPAEFKDLRDFVAAYIDITDDTVLDFIREVQFYFAWLDMMKTMKEIGFRFCYPELRGREEERFAADAYDLSLAIRTLKPVVPNDFSLTPPEQILVVTGPNQGGKSTFARAFGQVFYLASLGVSVPARQAALPLCDQVLTHFERGEDRKLKSGKLEEDVLRLKGLLDRSTKDSVFVVNEIYSSTTLKDALTLGGHMIDAITEKAGSAVVVTFMEELSEVGPQTVSMVSGVSDDAEHARTYQVRRRKADGVAFARLLAGKYGLTKEQLKGRLRK
ncbi:MAG: hypothetical protein IKN89_02005 [Oscillospiraceae bacterium]|nr:hypothetical protein [Oscillospiraceae bacterium]